MSVLEIVYTARTKMSELARVNTVHDSARCCHAPAVLLEERSQVVQESQHGCKHVAAPYGGELHIIIRIFAAKVDLGRNIIDTIVEFGDGGCMAIH